MKKRGGNRICNICLQQHGIFLPTVVRGEGQRRRGAVLAAICEKLNGVTRAKTARSALHDVRQHHIWPYLPASHRRRLARGEQNSRYRLCRWWPASASTYAVFARASK